MNCEDVIEQLVETEEDALSVLEQSKLVAHLNDCESCQDALRGANALRMVRNQPVRSAPDGLFDRVIVQATHSTDSAARRSQFWTGAAFGGLLAAGIAIAVVTLGGFQAPSSSLPEVPVVTMALGERQEVDIAIDADKDLPGTTVNVVLSGDFEFAGFGKQRELSWTTDLEKGVNRLTLPLLAVGETEGHLIVRLEHEGTRRVFRLDLNLSG
jgi:hypothetical protein